jgi:GNAT superfamily N-acetyltransferase
LRLNVLRTSDFGPATLGVRTEIAVDAARTSLEVRDGYAVVRTPQNPAYYHGNYLLFDAPPEREDAQRWPALFGREFAADPRVKHACFCWNAAAGAGASAAFESAGYTFEESAVMIARAIAGFPLPEDLRIRKMESERDWQQQLQMQLDDIPEIYEAQGYGAFKTAQIAHHRFIAETLGVWLGVFEGDALVGSCGIFPAGGGLARYQDVMVAKRYRNRGIARALICAAGRYALEHFPAETLVIVADARGFARRIYERAGFTQEQREARLWKADRKATP